MLIKKLETKILELEEVKNKRKEIKEILDTLKAERSSLKKNDPQGYLKSDRNIQINKERDVLSKQYKSLEIDYKLLTEAVKSLKDMLRKQSEEKDSIIEVNRTEPLSVRQQKLDNIYGKDVWKVIEYTGAHDAMIVKHFCGEEMTVTRATSMNTGQTKCDCERRGGVGQIKPKFVKSKIEKFVHEKSNGEYELVEYVSPSDFTVKHKGCNGKPFKATKQGFLRRNQQCECLKEIEFEELSKKVKEETHGTYELVEIGKGSDISVRHISCNGEPFKTNKTRFFKYGQRCKFCAKKGIVGRKSKLEEIAAAKDDTLD